MMRSRISLSGVGIKYTMGICSVAFSRRVRFGVINSARTGDLRKGVSGRSPMNRTLVKGGVGSIISIRARTKIVRCGMLSVGHSWST